MAQNPLSPRNPKYLRCNVSLEKQWKIWRSFYVISSLALKTSSVVYQIVLEFRLSYVGLHCLWAGLGWIGLDGLLVFIPNPTPNWYTKCLSILKPIQSNPITQTNLNFMGCLYTSLIRSECLYRSAFGIPILTSESKMSFSPSKKEMSSLSEWFLFRYVNVTVCTCFSNLHVCPHLKLPPHFPPVHATLKINSQTLLFSSLLFLLPNFPFLNPKWLNQKTLHSPRWGTLFTSLVLLQRLFNLLTICSKFNFLLLIF